ncbi:hypothetical protein [Brevibacterium oceani]|uniref:hypothetical protein n=1 Tax=Brevibacterium oceani TaxID=358099 RepID=UPI0015E6ECF5|nr:hypothetical protein [Brevibacterium oceani]
MPKPANPYAQTYANFLKNTEEHVLNVIHNDGLYRHLRFQEPGTRMWSMDLVTWPGHLATSGDIGEGLVFSREEDMIGFFASAGKVDGHYSDGAPSIDFRYWAEKIQGRGLVDVRKYDAEFFLQLVREHLEESEELGTEAQEFRDRQLALLKKIDDLRRRYSCNQNLPSLDERLEQHFTAQDDVHGFENSIATLYTGQGTMRRRQHDVARKALRELWSTDGLSQAEMDGLDDWFELADIEIPRQSPVERREEILDDARWHAESEHQAHTWLRDNEEHVGSDTWEWDLRSFDAHFLFACYCIDAAVRLYREHLAAQQAAEGTDAQPSVVTGLRVEAGPEQLAAVLDFAERGIGRELGAIDPRMTYTDDEAAAMKRHFEHARQGIDALRSAARKEH